MSIGIYSALEVAASADGRTHAHEYHCVEIWRMREPPGSGRWTLPATGPVFESVHCPREMR